MLLSKVGSHDSLKDQNASLSRELADRNNEVTRLQNQLNSNSGLVSQLQQDLERVNAELVTSQVCRLLE
jgi:predicted  nucleic acid-binding Zn-ribbon protein